MRLARYFPTVVVGLASIAGQSALPQLCRAYDSVPASILAQGEDSQSSGYIVDDSVQQAGYYSSRPRTNSGNAGISARQSAPRAAMPVPSPNEGPLYNGQKVKLPAMFGRQQKAPERTALRAAPPTSSPNLPNPAAYGQSQLAAQARMAGQTSMAGRPTQQPMPGASMPMMTSASLPPARTVSTRPPQLAAPNMRPAGAAAKAPNSSPVSPWNNQQPAPKTTRPTVKISEADPSQPGAQLSPTDRLVAEAHDLSTQAQTEQEFTQVIETCRRAQASQVSPATGEYAKNLIAWSLNRRGQLKAEAGQDKEAILDFDDAIRTDATCWRALHNRGVLLAQNGTFEKAFDDFARTIQMNPDFAKAYSNRAALFMVANNLDAALQDYNKAISLDPNLAVAHRGCGRVCQLLGQLDDAVGHFDAAVQLAPTDSYAAACRADLFTDVGRYSEAEAEYNRAIELDPKSTQAHSGSAWLLATCPDNLIRNADLAIQRAQTVIELGGEQDAVNYDTLAAAQANAGDFDAAMDSLRHAIELAPSDERDAYKGRLVLYQQAKPYRIAPVDRIAQVSYETSDGLEGVAR